MHISVLIKQLLHIWIYNIICWIRMMVSSMSRWKSLMLYFGGPLVRKKCIIMKTVVFNWNCLFFLYTFENHGSSYMINIYWLYLRLISIMSDSGNKLVRVSGQRTQSLNFNIPFNFFFWNSFHVPVYFICQRFRFHYQKI